MLNLPLVASLLIAIALIIIIGLICFKVFFDRVKQHETTVMIISVALAMLLPGDSLPRSSAATTRESRPSPRGLWT